MFLIYVKPCALRLLLSLKLKNGNLFFNQNSGNLQNQSWDPILTSTEIQSLHGAFYSQEARLKYGLIVLFILDTLEFFFVCLKLEKKKRK